MENDVLANQASSSKQTRKEKMRGYQKKYYLSKKAKFKCTHGKLKKDCIECKNLSLCTHCSTKYYCTECGGLGLCSHGKRKNRCKICGGQELCQHGKQKYSCKICGNNIYCLHEKRKETCVICKGTQICAHEKRRNNCKFCHGKNLCEHSRQKNQCKDCNLPSYLIHNQRNQIYRLMKLTIGIKEQHSIEYLGCDIEYFKDFIEKKMLDKMSWNNIHLDHIKPINSFDLENKEEFLQCCHYTNFQPLFAKDNLEKHDKWSNEDEVFWEENIRRKEYMNIYMPK